MSKTKAIIYGITIAVIVGLIITVCCLSSSLSKTKAERDKYHHNYDTAVTEMDTLRMKNGNLLATRDSYILTIDELEKQDILSKKTIKELQKRIDAEVAYISKLETEISIRPVIRDTVIFRDSSCVISRWIGNDRWYTVSGTSTYTSSEMDIITSVDKMSMSVPLTVGLSDDWKIFVTSENPYVQFDSVEGAVIDRKQRYSRKDAPRVGLGVTVGMNVGWNMVAPKDSPWNQKMYVGPGVGVGMYIRLF